MDMRSITVEDCILYAIQGMATVINDGEVIGFEKEEIPTATENLSGD